jgi:GAF domain-containing protein
LEFVESYLKTNSLTSFYDSVLIPVLTSASTDVAVGSLEKEQLAHLERSVREIVEDFGERPSPSVSGSEDTTGSMSSPSTPAPPCRVFCLPARAERDELAGLMLSQLLQQKGMETQTAPAKLVTGELLGLIQNSDVDMVCISVVAPSTAIHARYLCGKLRAGLPKLKILVGLWAATDELPETTKRLRDSGADEVVVSLAEASAQACKLAPILSDSMTCAPLPADDDLRLAALRSLHLLDTEAEPIFDRITAKLARIFDVPIALLTLVDRDRQFFKSQVGLPPDLAATRETSRDVSVCGHVVAENQVLVVEDLARDRRFANNPLLKQRGLRFYAGAPLRAPDGQPIGSLCLLDTKPRTFSERDQRQLQEYAREIMDEFARRVTSVPIPAA